MLGWQKCFEKSSLFIHLGGGEVCKNVLNFTGFDEFFVCWGGEILQSFKILDVWLAKMFSKLFHSGKVIFGGGGWAKICKILQVFMNFLCFGGGGKFF